MCCKEKSAPLHKDGCASLVFSSLLFRVQPVKKEGTFLNVSGILFWSQSSLFFLLLLLYELWPQIIKLLSPDRENVQWEPSNFVSIVYIFIIWCTADGEHPKEGVYCKKTTKKMCLKSYLLYDRSHFLEMETVFVTRQSSCFTCGRAWQSPGVWPTPFKRLLICQALVWARQQWTNTTDSVSQIINPPTEPAALLCCSRWWEDLEKGGCNSEEFEECFTIFSIPLCPFSVSSLWHCSGHVISFASWRQWCLRQFNIFEVLCTKKDNKMT